MGDRPNENSRPFATTAEKAWSLVILAVVGIVLGALGGLGTALFILVLGIAHDLIWDALPNAIGVQQSSASWVIPVTVSGGLLVGISRKYLGEYPTELSDEMESFRKTKRFDTHHIPNAAVTAIASLSFGAALGPEAALVAIVGGFSTILGDSLAKIRGISSAVSESAVVGAMGALFTPLAALGFLEDKEPNTGRVARLVPGFLAAITGWMVFKAFFPASYIDYVYPDYSFDVTDIAWALPVSLAAGLLAAAYLRFRAGLAKAVKAVMPTQVVIQSAVGGLILGLAGSLSFLALFSGHTGIDVLIEGIGKSGGWYLLGIGALKVVIAAICLETGWKGGQIFPLMFGGTAVGLAVGAFTTMDPMVGLAGGMAAAIAAAMATPLIAGGLVLLIVPWDLAPVIVVAAVVGSVLGGWRPSGFTRTSSGQSSGTA